MGVVMAIRWLEAHVKENNQQEASTKNYLEELECLEYLDFFETMCKMLEVKKDRPEDH